MQKIILASQSPRRKQLLEWAEIQFDVEASAADEHFSSTMPVEEIPVFIARNKAKAVQQKINNGLIILAADTIVVLNNRVITKPANRDEAVKILRSLSGKVHNVITGVVLLQNEKHGTEDARRKARGVRTKANRRRPCPYNPPIG